MADKKQNRRNNKNYGIIIQDSENKEKKYVYYAVIKTLN